MMSEDLERRRTEALEKLSERTGDLSGVTVELLNEMRREAVVEATEVVTAMNSEAKIVQRHNVRRLALRLAAAVVSWVWVAVATLDWHSHRHLGEPQVPLASTSEGQLPIGVMFTVLSFVFVAALLFASRRNGNGV